MNLNKEILKESFEIIIESWDEIEPIKEQKKITNRVLKERLEILKGRDFSRPNPGEGGFI